MQVNSYRDHRGCQETPSEKFQEYDNQGMIETWLPDSRALWLSVWKGVKMRKLNKEDKYEDDKIKKPYTVQGNSEETYRDEAILENVLSAPHEHGGNFFGTSARHLDDDEHQNGDDDDQVNVMCGRDKSD